MAGRITIDQKIQINKLYSAYHNMSKVAKEMGISPSTVSKYVDRDFTMPPESMSNSNVGKVDWGALDLSAFEVDELGRLLCFTKEDELSKDAIREELLI
jgi:AraC-like DNA-binding protein